MLARHELPSSAAAATRTRTNVLIVETDDQTLAELGVLPNVRRLSGARRFGRGQNLVRARVSVRFDRLVTKDVPISVCR